jgi:hypothetical protein
VLLRRRSRPKPAIPDWVPEDPRGDPAYARPSEWWEQVAGRPRHLTVWPGITAAGYQSPETGRLLDEWEFEPVLWLARNGHLTPAEVECIRDAARDAAPRVGTDREQMSWYTVSKDRSALRRALAVDAALAGEPDDGPDYGVGRGRHVDAEYPAP